MKYGECLPDTCKQVLKQIGVDLSLLKLFTNPVKQIQIMKYMPNAINNVTRMRDILVKYLSYFASDTRTFRVIKDQIYGGAQRIALVIIQQLNNEADEEFVKLAERYKHLNLENEQTQLKQSIHKSIKVQTSKPYESQRFKPQQSKGITHQQQGVINKMMINSPAQEKQLPQQRSKPSSSSEINDEVMKLKQEIEKLKQMNEEEKQKRILLQQQVSESNKQMMKLTSENTQLKQQVQESKAKAKAGKTSSDKKYKELKALKEQTEKEMEQIKSENSLLQSQITKERQDHEMMINQLKFEKKEFENSIIEYKQREIELRKEIESLKKKQFDTNDREEVKEFLIPFSHFYDGIPYLFNHMGYQFSIPTLGQIEEEKRYQYPGYGTPLNGKQRDLVVISRIEDNGEFEREGFNIIKKIFFEKSDFGKEKTIEIILPNSIIQPFVIFVQEGMFEIDGLGMTKPDKTKGSLVLSIELL